MFKAQALSPETTLAAAIDAVVTSILLTDASVLLTTVPGIATIGGKEVVRYTAISGNTLTGCTRGFEGIVQSWDAGTKVARTLTAHDIDAVNENLDEHQTGVASDLNLGHVKVGTNLTIDVDGTLNASGGGTATDVTYNNTTSGMTATNVQAAIDEHQADKATLTDYAHVQTGVISLTLLVLSDSGTASAGAATTLTDSTKTWTVNAYTDQRVTITGGTGEGQSKYIVSNTATELTVDSAWTTNPDATSEYEISAWVATEDEGEYLAPYTQTLTATGVTAGEVATVDVDLSGVALYADQTAIADAWGNVHRVEASAIDEITVYMNTLPTVNIPFTVKVVRG